MNKIVLIGRLTKAPEFKIVNDKSSICTFTIAVNRPVFKKDAPKEADFINIVVWNKRGESCSRNLDKGSLVGIDGRLELRKYSAKDGTTRYSTQVIANEVQFLDRKKHFNDNNSNSNYQSSNSNEFDGLKAINGEIMDDIPF